MEKKTRKSNIIRTSTDYTRTNTGKGPYKSVSSPHESVIRWQAPEYEYIPKDVSWYWLTLMASIILLALAIWQKNFLFAIFVVLAWFTIVSIGKRYPPLWNFKISRQGISIRPSRGREEDEKNYSFNDLVGFDIHRNSSGFGELIFKFKARVHPYLKINFPKEREEEIAASLSQHLLRQEYEESVADSLSKLIRF